jgi:hypothetical protein
MALLAIVPVMTVAGQARSTELPPAADDFIAEARATCAAFGDGAFSHDPAAVSRPDLNGDGTLDILVDAAHLHCSKAAGLYCGTAGCRMLAVVDGVSAGLFARGWKLVELGATSVLLLDYHGSLCGGTGVTPCVEALVWHDGGFVQP